MKKEKEYIPQFAEIDEPFESNVVLKKCKCCGNESHSLFKGVCFECRNKLSKVSKNNKQKDIPDEDLYMQWRESVAEKRMVFLMRGLMWKKFRKFGFAVPMLVYGIFSILLSLVALFSNFTLYNLIIFMMLFSFGTIVVVINAIYLSQYRKILLSKFKRMNNTIVKLNEYNGWKCPSCKFENDNIGHCERCGVLPILRKG